MKGCRAQGTATPDEAGVWSQCSQRPAQRRNGTLARPSGWQGPSAQAARRQAPAPSRLVADADGARLVLTPCILELPAPSIWVRASLLRCNYRHRPTLTVETARGLVSVAVAVAVAVEVVRPAAVVSAVQQRQPVTSGLLYRVRRTPTFGLDKTCHACIRAFLT